MYRSIFEQVVINENAEFNNIFRNFSSEEKNYFPSYSKNGYSSRRGSDKKQGPHIAKLGTEYIIVAGDGTGDASTDIVVLFISTDHSGYYLDVSSPDQAKKLAVMIYKHFEEVGVKNITAKKFRMASM